MRLRLVLCKMDISHFDCLKYTCGTRRDLLEVYQSRLLNYLSCIKIASSIKTESIEKLSTGAFISTRLYLVFFVCKSELRHI